MLALRGHKQLLQKLFPLCFTFPFLHACTVVQAGTGDCFAMGGAVGRGMTEIVCTPSRKIIVIPPAEYTDDLLVSDEGEILSGIPEEELPPPGWVPEPDGIPDELENGQCLINGCTILEISDTHINIRGGPPDASFWGGVWDGLMAVGTWVAAKYFGGSI